MLYCKVTTTLITKHTVWRTSISFNVSIHSTERTLNIRLRLTVQLRRCCKYDSVSTDRNLRDVHSYLESEIWCFVFQLFRTRQIQENSAFVFISQLSCSFFVSFTLYRSLFRLGVVCEWCRLKCAVDNIYILTKNADLDRIIAALSSASVTNTTEAAVKTEVSAQI